MYSAPEEYRELDEKFMKHLSAVDIRRHLLDLEAIGKRTYPGVGKGRVGVRIAYPTIPPTMDVFLVDNFIAEAQASSVTAKVEIAQDVLTNHASGSGDSVLLDVAFPMGSMVRRISFGMAGRASANDPPVVKPGVAIKGNKRAACTRPKGNLSSQYDEIDEIVHRLKMKGKLDSSKHVWDYLTGDQSLGEGDSKWPFLPNSRI